MIRRIPPRWRRVLLGVLLLLQVTTLAPVSAAEQAELERYERMAREAFSPEILRQLARRVGEIPDRRSVDVLAVILTRCRDFDAGTVANVNPTSVDLVRGYAMQALVKLRVREPRADAVIRQHFRITPATCVALIKTRYAPVYELMEMEINRILHNFPQQLAPDDLEPLTPALQFALRARPHLFAEHPSGSRRTTPHRETENHTRHNTTTPTPRAAVDTLVTACVILDHARTPQALQPLKTVLQHRYAFLWDKPAYRAIANLRLPASQRAAVLRRALLAARNRDRDECAWDWNHPLAIRFSIDTISSEAMLVLSLWRVPGSLQTKIGDVHPSLRSTSFTARAAAIDCLATHAGTTTLLAPLVRAEDVHTRRFLAFRLAYETNAPARKLLQQLATDRDALVANFARR